jgi:hypothetical protein
MKAILQLCLATVVLLLTVRSGRADVIFSDLVPGSTGAEGIIDEPLTAGSLEQWLAAAFTPANNDVVSDAQVKINYVVGHNPQFELSLYSDAGGAPGSSLGVIGTGTATSSTAGVFTVVTVNSPAIDLDAGTQYWLVMSATGFTTVSAWAAGGSPSTPSEFYDQDTTNGENGPWTSTGDSLQFQIDGTVIPGNPVGTPEPGTIAEVVAGMLAIVVVKKRFQRVANW